MQERASRYGDGEVLGIAMMISDDFSVLAQSPENTGFLGHARSESRAGSQQSHAKIPDEAKPELFLRSSFSEIRAVHRVGMRLTES
jgi:hypothetical protein